MPTVTNAVELEKMARAIMLLLFDNLNGQIDTVNTEFSTLDATFYGHLGRTNPNVAAEHIDAVNFYVGHVPSLIDAPVEKYPNCAVMAFNVIPVVGDDDWGDEFAVRVAVEIMCRSSSADIKDDAASAAAAEEVNMRLLRTTKAAHRCVTSDLARSLQGSAGQTGFSVPKLGNTPIITVGDVWAAKVHGNQARFLWQGARLEYRVSQWIAY